MSTSRTKTTAVSKDPSITVLTIREIIEFKNFESVFLGEDYRKLWYYSNYNWENFNTPKTLKKIIAECQKELITASPAEKEQLAKDMERINLKLKAMDTLSEIVKIGNGFWKRPRTLKIDLSETGNDRFLFYYIYKFVKGKTSASFDSKPLGFIVQTPEFKARVLNTWLEIKRMKNSAIPGYAVKLQ